MTKPRRTPNRSWLMKHDNATCIERAAEIIGVKRTQILRYLDYGAIKYNVMDEGTKHRKRVLYMPDVLRIKKWREERNNKG